MPVKSKRQAARAVGPAPAAGAQAIGRRRQKARGKTKDAKGKTKKGKGKSKGGKAIRALGKAKEETRRGRSPRKGRRRDVEALEVGPLQSPTSVQPSCGMGSVQLHGQGSGSLPVSEVDNHGETPSVLDTANSAFEAEPLAALDVAGSKIPGSTQVVAGSPSGALQGSVAPGSQLDCIQQLSRRDTLVQFGKLLAWGLRAGHFSLKGARAEPPRTAAFKRSGLFPLPAELPAEDQLRAAGLDPCNDKSLADDCWVGLGCTALNALYGPPQEGRTRRPGKVRTAALAEMKSKINRFLAGESPVSFSFEYMVEDIK